MINWHIEKRKLSELKDHPKNPRQLTHTQAQHLTDCMETFGIIDKIIINTDNTIIGGHARKKCIKKMGIKEVECYVPERELTEREVDELNIRLNKNTGDFDFDILANSWEIEDLLSWGFEEKDFIGYIEDMEPEEEKKKKEKRCPKCGEVI